MVCRRCKMIVKTELEKVGINPQIVDLGEIEIEVTPTPSQLSELTHALRHFGFEMIDDRKTRVINKMKNIIVNLVHHTEDNLMVNLSEYIASKIGLDYHYLSNLFSAVEGITIEKYVIYQRIEKAKELIAYDELTLSEIAWQLGYSSSPYLSNQFKKITGLTPTHFKALKEHKRKNIEEL